jgi:hypothetical protein
MRRKYITWGEFAKKRKRQKIEAEAGLRDLILIVEVLEEL